MKIYELIAELSKIIAGKDISIVINTNNFKKHFNQNNDEEIIGLCAVDFNVEEHDEVVFIRGFVGTKS